MASNRPFEPFSLATVMQNAEALRGMKRQGVLDDLQAKYLGGQINRAETAETRAQAQEGRAATAFTQEQQITNTRLLNMAAAEVAQNPAAASRWDPIIKAAIPNWEPITGGDPAQIQAAAKQLYDSTSQALQAFQQSQFTGQEAKPSALIEQYQVAQSQGYRGSLLDFAQELSQRQVGAQYGAPVNQPGIGVVQPSRIDPNRNVTLAPETGVVEAEAARAGAEATARNEANATAEQQKELTANQRTLEVWTTAKQGLMNALSNTVTNPVTGNLPAVTAGQQIAEGAIAATAPVLKQLFRSAGEGVFTDRDQQLLLDMVPKRTDHPETVAAKIEMIDAIIQAKLSASIPGDGPGQTTQTDAPQVGRFSVQVVE